MSRLVMLLLAVTALILAIPLPVFADILFLEGGGRVEGVVTDLGSRVKVQGLSGSVLVKKSEVLQHQKAPFITEIYADKSSRIDDGVADEHYRLAMWCRRNGLKKQGAAHLDRALELDPDHADTRATLGHVKFKGVWLSRGDALNAKMADRGFIKYEGRWFTEAGLLAWLDARREEQKIEAEAERRRVEREALARQQREEEERLALIEAERKVVEDALAAAQQTRRERDELLAQNRNLIDLLRFRSFDDGWYGGWMSYGNWYGAGYVGRRICGPVQYVAPRSAGWGFRINRGNVAVRGAFR